MLKFQTTLIMMFVLLTASWSSVLNGQDEITPIDENSPRQQAINFLTLMERENEGLETLYAEFTQVRTNQMFLEEINSTGEFYYSKPNRFRCNYSKPSDAEFYILDNMAYFYTVELKQVEKIPLNDGDQAPIHQMLVGFGLSMSSILDVFDPEVAEIQLGGPQFKTIIFNSKDEERTMGFRSIQVTFDSEKMEPKKLLIQEGDDEVSVTLEKIVKNKEIKDEVYALNFPNDVEIIEYK
ncbi:MAG: outer membrane lipoprotein carrier protein LolA [Sumerlaeia bacterium]